MKLSNKGRYGVRAIFDIAFHSGGKATQIKDISRRQAIPPRFLEQIFQDLKRSGLVTSKRGPRGGYALAMDPDIILADEPTGNLDSASGGDIMSLFVELSQQGRTLLMVTHDKALARRARRVIEIHDGLITSDRCTDEAGAA